VLYAEKDRYIRVGWMEASRLLLEDIRTIFRSRGDSVGEKNWGFIASLGDREQGESACNTENTCRRQTREESSSLKSQVHNFMARLNHPVEVTHSLTPNTQVFSKVISSSAHMYKML
jgi:hypothetical protein